MEWPDFYHAFLGHTIFNACDIVILLSRELEFIDIQRLTRQKKLFHFVFENQSTFEKLDLTQQIIFI